MNKRRRDNVYGCLPYPAGDVHYIAIWNSGRYMPWFVLDDIAYLCTDLDIKTVYGQYNFLDTVEISPQEIDFNGGYINLSLHNDHFREVTKMILINIQGLKSLDNRCDSAMLRELILWLQPDVLNSLYLEGCYGSLVNENGVGDKLYPAKDLLAQKEHEKKLKHGVKYPEYFDGNTEFQKWRRDMLHGLRCIADSEQLEKEKHSAIKALALVDAVIQRNCGLRLDMSTTLFNQQQLDAICELYGEPSEYDLAVFNNKNMNPSYVIYSIPELKAAYDEYVIGGAYAKMKYKPVDCDTYNEIRFW